MKAPEIIFLQWHGDRHPEDCCADDDVDPSGASWCWEQIFPADIEYIRMDKFDAVKRQRDELMAALRRLSFAATCRDNSMCVGDAIRLTEVKAELAAANEHACAAIAKVEG